MPDYPVPTSLGRILLVEDEPAFLRPMGELLRREGYECLLAGDISTAVQTLGEQPVELVISDIQMPGNSDLEFIHHLARTVPGLPVILLTGAPTVQTAAKSLHMPVVAYLLKPPNMAELFRIAGQAIGNYRVWSAARSSRRRLQDWTQELKALESRLTHRPGSLSSGAAGDYLGLALNHVLESLRELHDMSQILVKTSASQDVQSRADMLALLHRTVEVLERTKRSFKSEDLRNLRLDIQGLIDGLDKGAAEP